ncbi:MAG TPA: hypothetical protein PLN69_11485 [bacterium]|nr:hypothetical protein [bacterium]
MQKFNVNIEKLIEISETLLELADRGERDLNDDSCGVLYGVARDCAYKLKKLAECEKQSHIRSGKWN